MSKKENKRFKELLGLFKQIKQALGLTYEKIHEELNESYLPENESINLTTLYRWLKGDPPRGEALLALQEWISDKVKLIQNEDKTK